MKIRISLLSLLAVATCRAGEINPAYASKVADAIRLAENSQAHPYGVLAHYRHTSPRQACLNTVRHAYRDWQAGGSAGDFISFLGKRYAPIGANNDPMGLNRNWTRNVGSLLRRGD